MHLITLCTAHTLHRNPLDEGAARRIDLYVNNSQFLQFRDHITGSADDPGSYAVYGVGLKPTYCWDCGFESRLEHVCLSLVCVV